jgi:Lrp/AsnC family leucine-responsive transcriptional regulator
VKDCPSGPAGTGDEAVGAGRTPRMDTVDLNILRVLRGDGRASVGDLAEDVHVSRSTAYERLKRLRDDGILLGFSAAVDPHRVGLGTTAIVLLSSRHPRDWRKMRQQLVAIPQIEYAAYLTGTADVLVVLRFQDEQELRRVLMEELYALPWVSDTVTFHVLEEIVHRPYVLPGDEV